MLGAVVAAAFGLRDLLRRAEVQRSGYGAVHFFAAASILVTTTAALLSRCEGEAAPVAGFLVSLADAALVGVAIHAGRALRTMSDEVRQ